MEVFLGLASVACFFLLELVTFSWFFVCWIILDHILNILKILLRRLWIPFFPPEKCWYFSFNRPYFWLYSNYKPCLTWSRQCSSLSDSFICSRGSLLMSRDLGMVYIENYGFLFCDSRLSFFQDLSLSATQLLWALFPCSSARKTGFSIAVSATLCCAVTVALGGKI